MKFLVGQREPRSRGREEEGEDENSGIELNERCGMNTKWHTRRTHFKVFSLNFSATVATTASVAVTLEVSERATQKANGEQKWVATRFSSYFFVGKVHWKTRNRKWGTNALTSLHAATWLSNCYVSSKSNGSSQLFISRVSFHCLPFHFSPLEFPSRSYSIDECISMRKFIWTSTTTMTTNCVTRRATIWILHIAFEGKNIHIIIILFILLT